MHLLPEILPVGNVIHGPKIQSSLGGGIVVNIKYFTALNILLHYYIKCFIILNVKLNSCI